MRRLVYAINVTLDGCVDHRAVSPDDESHDWWAARLAAADALLYGRVTYEMMAAAWRPPASDALPPSLQPFARTIDAAQKYVVSSTLDRVDWNAELVRGDLAEAVRHIKDGPGEEVLMGGVRLPAALAGLGLIDEYELLVWPVIAGHGPTLLAGLPAPLDLRLVAREELRSGAVAMRYAPRD